MIILGIHDGHNASASLIEGSKLICAIQEERLVNIKNYCGFPKQAISYILEKNNISINDVDIIGFSSFYVDYNYSREEVLKSYSEEYKHRTRIYNFVLKRIPNFILNFIRSSQSRKNKNICFQKRKSILSNLGYKNKIEVLDHHLCHAATAYYGAPNNNKKMLVFTSDGSGDLLSSTVYVGKDNKLTKLASLPDRYSLARLYAMMTFKLGMVPLEHEYKLMGMAPYGDDPARTNSLDDIFSQIFTISKDDSFWRLSDKFNSIYDIWPFLENKLRFKRFDHICFSLQKKIETITIQWIKNWIANLGISDIACTGGIFMNVKLNKKIYEINEVKSLFIYPSCGDESLSIGACYYLSSLYKKPTSLSSLYLGYPSTKSEIDSAIKKLDPSQYSVTFYKDIEVEVATLLSKNHVVARHKGPFEFGARALGNRSILANPCWDDSVRVINDMIKKRDFWMPFASSVLEEKQRLIFSNPKNMDVLYMIITFDVDEKYKNRLKGGLHPRDFTTRPQVVSKNSNKDYHHLISCFDNLTDIPLILNTSLNLHGLPLAVTPEQSLYVFENSKLNYLALENYLITKNK